MRRNRRTSDTLPGNGGTGLVSRVVPGALSPTSIQNNLNLIPGSLCRLPAYSSTSCPSPHRCLSLSPLPPCPHSLTFWGCSSLSHQCHPSPSHHHFSHVQPDSLVTRLLTSGLASPPPRQSRCFTPQTS